jgi:hypothetical protein
VSDGEEERQMFRKQRRNWSLEWKLRKMGGLPMKSPVVIATAMVCGLGMGYSGYSRSGDLDAALENINISTDAREADKNPDKDKAHAPCEKAAGMTCPTGHDDANSNAYQASTIQGAIVGNTIPNVTINGVPSGTVVNRGAVSLGGP